MNYYWKYKIFSFSDGSHGRGDFDDWSAIDFSFFKNSHFELPNQNTQSSFHFVRTTPIIKNTSANTTTKPVKNNVLSKFP